MFVISRHRSEICDWQTNVLVGGKMQNGLGPLVSRILTVVLMNLRRVLVREVGLLGAHELDTSGNCVLAVDGDVLCCFSVQVREEGQLVRCG